MDSRRVLAPIIFYCKLCGTLTDKSPWLKAYALVLMVLSSGIVCWHLPQYLIGTSFQKFNTIINFSNILVSVLCVLRNLSNLRFVLFGQHKFNELLDGLDIQLRRLGCCQLNNKFDAMERRLFCFTYSLAVIIATSLYAELATYPYDFYDILFYIAMYTTNLLIIGSNILLGALAELTKILLNDINEGIKEMHNCLDEEETRLNLRRLRTIYSEVGSAVPKTSATMQDLALPSLIFGFCNTMSAFYYLLLAIWDLEKFFSPYRLMNIIMTSTYCLVYSVQVIYFSSQCDFAIIELCDTSNRLYKLEMDVQSNTLKEEIYLFRQETMHFHRLKYSPYGLFNLDRAQMANLVGAVGVYIATLIQFHMLYLQLNSP